MSTTVGAMTSMINKQTKSGLHDHACKHPVPPCGARQLSTLRDRALHNETINVALGTAFRRVEGRPDPREAQPGLRREPTVKFEGAVHVEKKA